MITLPDYIIDAYERIPTGKSMNVMIRHSNRFPITSDEEVFTAQLTPEGEKLAFTYGAWINRKFDIGKIFSSPIERCLETGRQLSKGAGNGRLVLPEPILSHPNENGEYDALDEYLETGVWPDRITQIKKLFISTNPGSKLNFFVTHDTVLALMAAYLLKMDIRAPKDWPRFLEPMFFWKDQEKKMVSFRGNDFLI